MQSATLPEIIAPRPPEPARTGARADASESPFSTTLEQVHHDEARTARPAQDDAVKPSDQASKPVRDAHDDAPDAAETGSPAATDGKPAPAKPVKADGTDQAPADPIVAVSLPTDPALPAIPVEVTVVVADAPQPIPPVLPDALALGDTLPVSTQTQGQFPLPLPKPGLAPATAAATASLTTGLPPAATQAAVAAQLAALAHTGKDTVPATQATTDVSATTTPGTGATAPADASLLAALSAAAGTIAPVKDAKEDKTATPAEVSTGDGGAAAATAAIPLPTPVVNAASAPAAKIQASAITLGDKARKAAPDTGKTSSESAAAKSGSAFDGLVQQQGATTAPAAPTAPVQRPLSETIAAQDALAAAGNAAEKAVSQQVGKALVQTLPGGDKMMVLRLTPPELGTVRIEVVEHQGVLSARLHAEDDGVRVALERFLPQMQRDLRAQDAPIQEITLSDQAQFDRSFADTSRQSRDQDGGARGGRDDGPAFAVDGAGRSDEPIGVTRSLGGRSNARGVDAFA
jgi:flagellar hook-length control protein FliK